MYSKVNIVTSITGFLVFLIATLKLYGVIDVSWWLVIFSPILLPIIYAIVIVISYISLLIIVGCVAFVQLAIGNIKEDYNRRKHER